MGAEVSNERGPGWAAFASALTGVIRGYLRNVTTPMLSRPFSSLSEVLSSSRPFHSSVSSLSSSRIPYISHTPLTTSLHPHSQWPDALPSPMEPPLLPNPLSQPTHGRAFRRWKILLRSSPLRLGAFFGALIFVSLVYTTFLSPHDPVVWYRPSDWHDFSQHETPISDLENASPGPTTIETPQPSPSPSPISNVLTVEQIRDIVAPTRGFFTRDYSLGLGWNNVSVYGVPFDPN